MPFPLRIFVWTLLWSVTLAGAYFWGTNQAAESAEAHTSLMPTYSASGSRTPLHALTPDELAVIEQYRARKQSESDLTVEAFHFAPNVTPQAPEQTASIANPVESLRELLHSPDFAPEKAWLLLAQMNDGDLAAFLSDFNVFDGANSRNRMARYTLFREALARWAKNDPHAAFTFIQNSQDARRRGVGIPVIIETWAAAAPDEALRFFLTQIDPSSRDAQSAVFGLFRQLGTDNFDRAVSAAQGLETTTLQANAYQAIIQAELSKTTPNNQRILGLLNSDLPQNERTNLIRRTFGQGNFDDARTASSLIQNLGDPQLIRTANESLASSLARVYPQKAIEFALSLDEDAGGSSALRNSATQWITNNITEMAEWLNQQPSNPRLDPAYQVFAERASREDPGNAITWAEAIIDDNTRRNAINAIAQRWIRTEPQAAKEYIESTPNLTTEQKRQLMPSDS